MFPYLEIPSLKIVGPLELHAFGALVALAFIVGSSVASWRAKQVGLKPQVIQDMAFHCIVFGMIGAHLFDVFASRPEVLRTDPMEILRIWSGISSYGGFIGAGIAIWIYFLRKKLPFYPYADTLMFGLGPGWFLGRLGCFTAHDHPGRLTDSIFGVQYPGGARFDGGLNDMIVAAIVTAIVFFLGRKKDVDDPPAGTIYAAVLILYAVPRFFLDFLRAVDHPRMDPRYLNLTPSQYASMAIVALGVYVLVRVRRAPHE